MDACAIKIYGSNLLGINFGQELGFYDGPDFGSCVEKRTESNRVFEGLIAAAMD
jgi:hypothetical protein